MRELASQAGRRTPRRSRPDAARMQASTCAQFVLERAARRRGPAAAHLHPRARHIGGYLEDHAFLLEALLVLFEATFEERWLIEARDARRADDRALRRPRARRLLLDRHRRRGADRPAQGARGQPDPIRRLERRARPAAAGADLTGEESYERHALGVLRAAARDRPAHPSSFGHLLQALELHLSPAAALACAVPPARSTAGESQTPPA